MPIKEKKIAIVGAGFSGLSAARELVRQGEENLVILEARDRVGGRVKPGKLGHLSIDLGGMWMGPSQTRLMNLAKEFGVESYATPLDGKSIVSIMGKEHHGDREEIDGLFNILEGLDYLNVRRKLDKLMQGLDTREPWSHPNAHHLDSYTLEHWLRAEVNSKRIRELFRLACFSLFCAESDQVSMLFFLHYVKAGDGFDTIISADKGGAQNFLLHGGLHQIAQKMALELGDKLIFNSPVHKIRWANDEAIIESEQGDYKVSRVIMALPPTMVPSIGFLPALPKVKSALHKRLAMGSAIKFWLLYETPFWRDQGFNGSLLIDDLACTPIYDVSPPNQSYGVLAGFFDGDHALVMGDKDSEARKDIVVKTIVDYFGHQGQDVIDYVDTDWNAEEWSQGCYGAFAAPGIYHRYGEWLSKPFGPFYWAGTETSPNWTGYVEGAIIAGERAAQESLN